MDWWSQSTLSSDAPSVQLWNGARGLNQRGWIEKNEKIYMAKLERWGREGIWENTKESLSKAMLGILLSFKRNETLLKAFELNIL